MISSMITVYEARSIKNKALNNYRQVVDIIKGAASKGEDGVYVDDSLISSDIRKRLNEDNFEVDCGVNFGKKHEGTTRIYWG